MHNDDHEWSRSRYWLGHFLYSRHERQPIEWTRRTGLRDEAIAPLARWLAGRCRLQPMTNDSAVWLLDNALRHYSHDPAYIQSLRLMAREHRCNGELIGRLLARYGVGRHTWFAPTRLPLRRRLARWRRASLGSRFDMSLCLLSDLLDLTVLILLDQAPAFDPDATLYTACLNLRQDKQAHIAFTSERLTMLYADFNFIRRNVRRLRLRLMWTVYLVHAAMRHGHLIRVCGATRWRFVSNGYRLFSRLLERMVPYRRDALLAALLNQRQDPYAEPEALAG